MTQNPVAPPRVADRVLQVHAANLSEHAEVRFQAGPTVMAKLGDTLLRVAEANQVPIESGCRMGMCGSDPVSVLGGAEHLSPPTGSERATLQWHGFPANCRMACIARVRGAVSIAVGTEQAATAILARVPATPRVNPGITPAEVQRVVIVGTGVAGVTAAFELRARRPDLEITILGAEIYDFYNRMSVSKLVSGATSIDRLCLLPKDWPAARGIRCRRSVTVQTIDAPGRRVLTEDGQSFVLGGDARYIARTPPTTLKVAGVAVLSVGAIDARGEGGREIRRGDGNARQYRKVVLAQNRLQGAIVIGHPELFDVVSAAVTANLDVGHALAALEAGDWSMMAN